MAKKKTAQSEVHAYGHIRELLKELSWDVRNPDKYGAGQVYTQNECFGHPELKACFGLQRPENVVKVSESVWWVIEGKNERKKIGMAVGEAEYYADLINKGKKLKALFISGVAGNDEESYVIETKYLVNGKFKPVTLNGKAVSSLVSPELAKTIVSTGNPNVEDVPIDEKLFLTKAEKINEYLHLGAINKNYRAQVMAALLLALIDETSPNIDAKPNVLIEEINARVRAILEEHKKPNFYEYVKIALPATPDNHVKFKKALVRTIQELFDLNIRSAMNSGTDVLGKFYEVFLKYGNGAKEIGIVLTPRHIAKFAVDVLGATDQDVVYDPTCGTGGFLVAAFDAVKQNYPATQLNKFKVNNLFGVEQESHVVALAIVNMIFRGDGKNNITEGNCFNKYIVRKNGNKYVYAAQQPQDEQRAVTRVLMNPPFALKSSDEKEYKFVDQALKQMVTGGLLFSVLPYSSMVKPGAYQDWRGGTLLTNHTLLAVVTFPGDLFYPVGVHTVGIFVRAGIPHPKEQNVLWIRAVNDGLLKKKGKRLPHPKAKNDYPVILPTMKGFVASPALKVVDVEQFQKASPIDFDDPLLELVPENYLDQEPPSDELVLRGIENVIRESVAFMIKAGKEEPTQ